MPTKIDFGSTQVARQTRDTDLDFGGGRVGSSVDSSDVDSQSAVEKLKVKKQQQQQPEQEDPIKPKGRDGDGDGSRTISRRLWYGVFLTCGLLLVPITPGTAFLVLPMQVAGFAMIPLNKKETKTLLNNVKKNPKDYLLNPEEKIDDAILHGLNEEGGKPNEEGKVVPGSTTARVSIDFAGSIGTDRVTTIPTISADVFKTFLSANDISIDDRRMATFLGGEEQVSASKIQELCVMAGFGEADPRRQILERLAENLKTGNSLSSVSSLGHSTSSPSRIPSSPGVVLGR